MMGDDPLKCPKCSRYVDDETATLDHTDSCPWADLSWSEFARRAGGDVVA